VKPVRPGPPFFEPKATVLPYQRGGEAMSVLSLKALGHSKVNVGGVKMSECVTQRGGTRSEVQADLASSVVDIWSRLQLLHLLTCPCTEK
jgi:hypothetical protein